MKACPVCGTMPKAYPVQPDRTRLMVTCPFMHNVVYNIREEGGRRMLGKYKSNFFFMPAGSDWEAEWDRRLSICNEFGAREYVMCDELRDKIREVEGIEV